MIYERYPDAYSLDTYEQLLDVEIDPSLGDPLQRLVLSLYASASVAALDDRRTYQERTIQVEWEADAVPLREARQLVSTYGERAPPPRAGRTDQGGVGAAGADPASPH